MEHLKEKNKSLEEDSKDLKTVIDLLRKGSDSDAAAVLARLRVGHSITSIVQSTPGFEQPPSRADSEKSTDHAIDPRLQAGSPNHLQDKRIIDRNVVWGRQIPHRGVPPPSQQHATHGLQHQPRSRYTISSNQQPQYPPQALNTRRTDPAVAQQVDHQMTTHHGQRLNHPTMAYHEQQEIKHEEHDYDQAVSQTAILHPDERAQEMMRLRNFGNMDFSSGILANGHPWDIQQQQVSNLFTPQWMKMTVPVLLPQDHPMRMMCDSLAETISDYRRMLGRGMSLLEIAGPHPRLAAIMSQEEFDRAPSLSQWASKMVYSIKESNKLFVCYASMYLFWWIMRWMICPSPETYFAIPEFLRPSPTQLFVPHVLSMEFIAWPGLRDFLCHSPQKSAQSEWMYDMSLNIACDCPVDESEMMAPSPVDGELELSPKALASASDVNSWSVTPSFRQYFLDADKWMRIRWEDEA